MSPPKEVTSLVAGTPGLRVSVSARVQGAAGAPRGMAHEVEVWVHRGHPGASILQSQPFALVMEHRGLRFTVTEDDLRDAILRTLDQAEEAARALAASRTEGGP